MQIRYSSFDNFMVFFKTLFKVRRLKKMLLNGYTKGYFHFFWSSISFRITKVFVKLHRCRWLDCCFTVVYIPWMGGHNFHKIFLILIHHFILTQFDLKLGSNWFWYHRRLRVSHSRIIFDIANEVFVKVFEIILKKFS